MLLDAGVVQDLGGDTSLAPGGAVDALALGVAGGDRDELGGEPAQVVGVVAAELGQLPLQVGDALDGEDLLDHVAGLQRQLEVGLGVGQLGADRLGGALPSALGLVGLQRREVRDDDAPLLAADVQRGQVLVAELLLLGGGHFCRPFSHPVVTTERFRSSQLALDERGGSWAETASLT